MTHDQRQRLSVVPQPLPRQHNELAAASPPPALPSTLPPDVAMKLIWQTKHMEANRRVGEEALGTVSDVTNYATYRLTSTLQMTTMLKQLAQQGGWLTPEMEEHFARMTMGYMQTIMEITGEVSAELMATVREFAESSRHPSTWERVLLWLQTH